jgi:glycosyltransferase involved in cell wall biosynthesis
MQRGRPGLRGIVQLTQLVRNYRPAVVQSWMYHANLVATAALSLSGLRARTTHYWGIRCSDMDLEAYGRAFRLVVKAGARLSRWPDAVTCNSQVGIGVHEALGYRPRRFILIDNGIDTARFKPDGDARAEMRATHGLAPDTPLIAVAARVDPMKDYPTLLAALETLPNVKALVMGEGTENLPEIPNLIKIGRSDAVPRLLAAADLIVSASAYGEGFSNAIAEGMACGLPAVATDVGDARRIIGATGVVVPPRDPRALARAIDGIFKDSGRIEQGLAARARIEEEFALERAVARFRQLHRDGV